MTVPRPPSRSSAEIERRRFADVPASSLREWTRLRSSGMVRINEAAFYCVCGEWHRVAVRGFELVHDKKPRTGEELAVLAARQSRMLGCPMTKTGKRCGVDYGRCDEGKKRKDKVDG